MRLALINPFTASCSDCNQATGSISNASLYLSLMLQELHQSSAHCHHNISVDQAFLDPTNPMLFKIINQDIYLQR